MSKSKIYWRGSEELEKDPSFLKTADKEFSEELPIEQFLGKKELDSTKTNRRDFLKFMGFGITAATLAACETPVVKSLPYVVKPNDVMPGIANYYASTYFDGTDYGSIVVKTREGRPIHIEGNKLSPVTKGCVSARINSSVLSLYNTKRYQAPMIDGTPVSWSSINSSVVRALQTIKETGGNARILSSTIISPSSLELISKLKVWMEEDGASLTHTMYDADSYSAVRAAHKATHGSSIVPNYHFDKAKSVVSISSDFVINGINPVGFARDYGVMRNPDTGMSRHYQFETTLTSTGSAADVRGAIKPSEQGAIVLMLHNAIARLMGKATVESKSIASDDNGVQAKVSDAAKHLVANKEQSIVIAGANNINIQMLVNAINEMLGNYGTTLNVNAPLHLRKGDDASVAGLVSEMKTGVVDAIMLIDCDPIYNLPGSLGFAEALSKVKTRIAFSEKPNASSEACNHVCATGHYLEHWNDANPAGDSVSFTQPAIRPIYDTKQWQDSFLSWLGDNQSYYDFLKAKWNSDVTAQDDPNVVFTSRWNKSIQDGVATMSSGAAAKSTESNKSSSSTKSMTDSGSQDAIAGEVSYLASSIQAAASAISGGTEGWEIDFYKKAGIGTGNYSDNPWLQELPDPVTRVVWDHYATMNPMDMKEIGLNTMMGEQQRAGMIRIYNDAEIPMELPVVSLPGQKRSTIGVALGYGNTIVKEESVERLIGKNAYAVLSSYNGNVQFHSSGRYEKLEMRYNIASTQSSHTMMGRKILNETTLSSFENETKSEWNPEITVANAYGEKVAVDKLDLWNEHAIDLGHRWGMSIDLNSCIGCGACVTACHSENNVPIVGKDEVNRMRTMSWIRIDRYYSSDADPELHGDINQQKDYGAMEIPSEYPEVGFMPVMCQHCNHAPCETVCPVAATTHSDEGYNQMTYNRCIGTRYCANNCPYKVRRFNWFNYVADPKFTNLNPSQDDLSRMVLNPDVVVRSRGVMEKCSMCVQRVQAAKLEAKKAGIPIQDGTIQAACGASCPTDGITFGDINDVNSKVRSAAKNDRAYHLLEEIGVKPNVWYQTKVRNSSEIADQTA